MNPENNELKQPTPSIERSEKQPNILTEQNDNFEVDKIEHELIPKYQPKFLIIDFQFLLVMLRMVKHRKI